MARKLLAVLLLGLGIALGLDALNVIEFGEVWTAWWPLLLVAVGLVQLAQAPRHWLTPIMLMVGGGVFLVATLDLVEARVDDLIAPVVLVVIGLSILLGRIASQGGLSGRRGETGATIDSFVAFGGRDLVSRSPSFAGGSVVSLFGGTKVDLRQAHLAGERASLGVTSLFGGTDILIPEGWDVDIHGLPLFGGIEDKTAADLVPAGAPVLDVQATALFGGVTVKH